MGTHELTIRYHKMEFAGQLLAAFVDGCIQSLSSLLPSMQCFHWRIQSKNVWWNDLSFNLPFSFSNWITNICGDGLFESKLLLNKKNSFGFVAMNETFISIHFQNFIFF